MEHVIKRYKNRKFYDTAAKKYINLKDIENLLKSNRKVVIFDVSQNQDVTRQVLSQIILKKDEPFTVENLEQWIVSGGQSLRRAFEKTMQVGRDIAGRIEKDVKNFRDRIYRGEIISSFDIETLSTKIDTVSGWVVELIEDRLRRNLLRIPSRDDLQYLHELLDQLEVKIDDLQKQKEACDGRKKAGEEAIPGS